MYDILKKVRQNWKSGVTVALISLPLSVSLAVASQATPVEGIITAIWAGLIASLLGGSNFNIIGPTGALSGILAAYVIGNGVGSLSMLAIVSGVMVMIAYILRLEKYISLIPASTVHGFTLGVAFIISLGQLNSALGLKGLPVHEKLIQNVFESFAHIAQSSIPAVVVFAVFLVALFLFRKFLPKVPGAIILAPVGILLGFLAANQYIPLELQTLGDKFPEISPKLFQMPHLYFSSNLILPAFTVSLVAILETMISAKIGDGMTKTKHDRRREMFGLSFANIASGFFGGIPATAALARTSLNIKSGATDKMSGTISSLAIIVISILFLGYFKFIPMAVIASILVFIAVKMIERERFENMLKFDKTAFAVSLIVAIITIVEDPIIGIAFGTVVSLLIYIEKSMNGQFELIINRNKKIVGRVTSDKFDEALSSNDILVYSFKGQLNYMNGNAHVSRFEHKLNGHLNVILRMREVHFLDIDGIDALDNIIDIIKSHRKKVLVTGVNPMFEPILRESESYTKLKKKGLVFEKTSQALAFLGQKVR